MLETITLIKSTTKTGLHESGWKQVSCSEHCMGYVGAYWSRTGKTKFNAHNIFFYGINHEVKWENELL